MATEAIVPIILGGFRTSAEIGKISLAMSKAQGEFAPVLKDSKNPFFKSDYADLASVLSATRKSLSANGVAVIQSPRMDLTAKAVIITTMLCHSSGEWMADDLIIPIADKITAQTVGSAVTYGRRYALQAFLGVAGEDDDGNAATGKEARQIESSAEYDQRTETQTRINSFQVTGLNDAMKRTGKTETQVTAYLKEKGYRQFEEVTKADFQAVLKWLNGPIVTSKEDLTPALNKTMETTKVPENMIKRIFASANEKNIPEADVKQVAYETFKVSSMKDLNLKQSQQMVEWVKSQ